ncbi:MAG: hypothetical protein ACKOXB_11520 [Flavobacteriales bacterium]
MIAKSFLLIVTIFIFGLLTVTGLIFTIVKWKERKARIAWLITGSISLFITVAVAAYFLSLVMIKTVETATKVGTAVNNTEKKIKNAIAKGLAAALTDNREYLLDTIHPNKQIALLKSYEPDSFKNKVPNKFYTYFGIRDWFRFPLPYPYSIHCLDMRDYGNLYDERDILDISKNSNEGVSIAISGIRNFTYDKNILVGIIEEQYAEEKNKTYFIFHFASQQTEEFSSLEELKKRTKELKFDGPKKLLNLKEYDSLFLKHM